MSWNILFFLDGVHKERICASLFTRIKKYTCCKMNDHFQCWNILIHFGLNRNMLHQNMMCRMNPIWKYFLKSKMFVNIDLIVGSRTWRLSSRHFKDYVQFERNVRNESTLIRWNLFIAAFPMLFTFTQHHLYGPHNKKLRLVACA